VALFAQTTLGGGVGRLQSEGMREEVHRFDEIKVAVFCSVDRHFFARQLCVMRKAESLVGHFFSKLQNRACQQDKTKAPTREEAGA